MNYRNLHCCWCVAVCCVETEPTSVCVLCFFSFLASHLFLTSHFRHETRLCELCHQHQTENNVYLLQNVHSLLIRSVHAVSFVMSWIRCDKGIIVSTASFLLHCQQTCWWTFVALRFAFQANSQTLGVWVRSVRHYSGMIHNSYPVRMNFREKVNHLGFINFSKQTLGSGHFANTALSVTGAS